MKMSRILASMAAVSLLAMPFALGTGTMQGKVEAEAIEAQTDGETVGPLVALFIDHYLERHALPTTPALLLESPSATVVSHHAPAKASTFDVGAQEVPVYTGQIRMDGAELRPGLQLLVTPLNVDGAATVRVEHEACTLLEPPRESSLVREPMVNKSRPPLVVSTGQSIRLVSCTQAHALVEGDLRVSVWEWDVDLNGERVKTGVHDDAPGAGSTGIGSADELEIHAHNATLRIPLTPETYTLHLGHPELAAGRLRLTNAEGTLPGLLGAVDGENVTLEGEYAATVTARGVQQPLSVSLTGTTQTATADGEVLSLAPPAPSGVPMALVGVTVAGIILVGLLSGRFLWPLFHRPQDDDTSVSSEENAPATTRRPVEKPPSTGRDVDAERAILRVVRKSPGATGRKLRDRLRMSTERITAAADALVERGALVRKGSGSRWHYFLPSPDLDEVWEQKAALQNLNLRLALDLLEEFAGAPQRELIAVARERLNWGPSTTRNRLRRLAAVGLAKATESGPEGPQSVVWTPAQPTEGN